MIYYPEEISQSYLLHSFEYTKFIIKIYKYKPLFNLLF